jgi:hypothetical protein
MEPAARRTPAELERQIADMVRYDAELRRLMVARGGLEAEMLDFLLGRPVELVLRFLKRGRNESHCG